MTVDSPLQTLFNAPNASFSRGFFNSGRDRLYSHSISVNDLSRKLGVILLALTIIPTHPFNFILLNNHLGSGVRVLT
jgi:hypothetical protein